MSSIGKPPPVNVQGTGNLQGAQPTGAGAKIKDFFVSIGQGLAKAGSAIGKFFGETVPNFFKGIGDRLATIATPNPTGSGAVGPSGTLDAPGTVGAFTSGKLPQGLTVDHNNNVTGTTTLDHAFLGDGDVRVVSMDEALQETAENSVVAKGMTTVPLTGGGSVEIPNKSVADMHRMDIELPGGFNTSKKDSTSIGDNLRAFTGSDKATTVLSSVLTQYTLRRLEVLPGQNGERIGMMMPPNTHKDGTFIDSYKFTGNDGTVTDFPGKPGQYGEAQVKVDTYPNGDFRVTIDWPMHIEGFKDSQGNSNRAPLGEPGNLMKAMFHAEIRVDKQEADLGNLSLSLPQSPTVTYSGNLTGV